MKSKLVFTAAFTALIASNLALAEGESVVTAPAAGTSTASAPQKAANVSDFLSVVYSTTYHGSSLSDPFNFRAAGPNGKLGSGPQYFDGDITALYKVSPDFGVGLYVPFLFSPVSGLSANVPTQGLTNGDTGLAFHFHNIIKTASLRVSSMVYLQAPTSSYSASRKMDIGIKATPSIRYQEPGSPLAVGAYTEIKDYAGSLSGKNIKLWALPYVAYSLSDTFAVQGAFEYETDHNVGGHGLDTYESDFQPGFIWSISKNVSINPYAQFFTTPTKDNTINRTALGAFIRAQIL